MFCPVDAARLAPSIDQLHGQLFRELLRERRPLPEAVELLAELRTAGVAYGIATSGRRPEIDGSLEALGLGAETVVVERGDVERAKPEPDLFLECAAQLGVPPEDCYVVGDAVWDLLAARRARMLSIGLLSGGYGEDELIRALGPASVEAVIDSQGDLGSFRTFQKQPAWRGRSIEGQLRRFMGSADRRKIRYARLLVAALDLDRVPRPLDGVLAHV